MTEILSQTESVCPECLTRLPAVRVQDGEDVYLEKTCPRHGDFRTIIWHHYRTMEMVLGGGVACKALRDYHIREADLYF